MKKQIIVMFSGQGSQYYQMGKELYNNHSRFRYWMDHCDEIAHPFVKTSLVAQIYQEIGKDRPFDRIAYTNPALICIEYSLARVLMEMGVQPDYLMGYSLGEITAAIVSGVISLKDGLRLVIELARLVEENTPRAEILAIIEPMDIMAQMPDLFRNCRVMGINFSRNFVVGGLPQDIRRLENGLTRNNKLFQKLPVKYGFHTELMDPIEKEFKQFVRNIEMGSMTIPIISSLSHQTVEETDADFFWNVIRRPVDFEKTVEAILAHGDYVFVDAGPSGIMASFVNYNLADDSTCQTLQMINQFGHDLDTIEKLRIRMSDYL